MNLVKELKYSFHIMFHPFDGFWDMKHEHRGSKRAAYVLLALLVVTFVIKTQFTGYLYNPAYDGVSLNVFNEFIKVVGTFFLWCVANWSLTTLMDGEGSFGDIVMASAYALTPMILIHIPLAFVSNVMTAEYAAFYTMLNTLAIGWSAMLMICSVIVIHQYSLTRTFFTCLLIIVAMMIIVFLLLLFFQLFSQLLGFAVNLYWEISLRFF